jgi:hypothetical protein
MKTKPIIIAAIVSIVLASAVLFILYGKSANKTGDEAGVKQFLTTFTKYARDGQVDSLLSCFEIENQTNDGVQRMVRFLAGKNGVNGKSAPLAEISFDLDESIIETLADGTLSATVPAFFNHDELETKRSVLILKISRSANGGYKIIQADARQFFTDFIAYENFVRSKTLKDEDIYDPLTLAAFAKAKQLLAKYDSVIWFSHIQDKTYYYVVNGKWEEYDLLQDTAKTYKMGLVGPDLNLVIPVEFDLVGQIGVTFPDLIEVQKNKKKGFYDLNGKVVLPVIYDQVFPVDGEGDNIAAIRNGDDYFWLKSDYTVSEKADIKIAEILPNLKKGNSFNLNNVSYDNVVEYNSRDEHSSIYLSPSYLVDLSLLPVYKSFKNPLRRQVQYGFGSENYSVTKDIITNNTEGGQEESWWETAYYSIRDHFLDGRAEFYNGKNLVIVDKKRNKLYTAEFPVNLTEFGEDALEGPCNVSSFRVLNDSIFEVKVGTVLYQPLYDTTKDISGGPYYYYLTIKNNKLEQSRTNRNFAFTKFVKMDDSYLNGCYILDTYNNKTKIKTSKRIDNITPEMLKVMKNEIYADYGFEFKDKRWEDVFNMSEMYHYDDGKIKYSKNVEDSLTAIDRYNLNFIDQKLKAKKTTTLAAQ